MKIDKPPGRIRLGAAFLLLGNLTIPQSSCKVSLLFCALFVADTKETAEHGFDGLNGLRGLVTISV